MKVALDSLIVRLYVKHVLGNRGWNEFEIETALMALEMYEDDMFPDTLALETWLYDISVSDDYSQILIGDEVIFNTGETL